MQYHLVTAWRYKSFLNVLWIAQHGYPNASNCSCKNRFLVTFFQFHLPQMYQEAILQSMLVKQKAGLIPFSCLNSLSFQKFGEPGWRSIWIWSSNGVVSHYPMQWRNLHRLDFSFELLKTIKANDANNWLRRETLFNSSSAESKCSIFSLFSNIKEN